MAKKKRNPWIAALLTFGGVGLGQVYNGQPGKGIACFIGFVLLQLALFASGLEYTFTGFAVEFIAATIGFLAILTEAAISAKKAAQIELAWYHTWYWYLILIIFAQGTDMASDNWVRQQIVGVKMYQIPGESMFPAVLPGDRIAVDIAEYRTTDPDRGHIILLRYPQDPTQIFLKRIAAAAGDTVQIIHKQLMINNQPVLEPYIHFLPDSIPQKSSATTFVLDNYGPQIIPSEHFFVLGDNRDQSADSRVWGFVPQQNIIGRAIYVYWSDDKSRLGRTLK